MNEVQVDFNLVIRKLQERVAEAVTTIAFLEAQVEAYKAVLEDLETNTDPYKSGMTPA